MISIAYSLPTRGELRDYSVLADNQAIRVFGNVALGDMASEIWLYKTASMADNGTTVMKPTDINVSNPVRWILFEKMAMSDYTKTNPVSGGAGNAVFYLTNDGTATGAALFSNVTYVNPIVNDSAVNYTYGWSYNSSTKALTVNVKSATGLFISLLNLTLLGTPANVANGVQVSVLVKGN